ncbi:MAG: alpha/beta hydrolase [Ardenticatenia bacterium]|nr:alpha/beta hydrolase [Ardenticatenia bacterium]
MSPRPFYRVEGQGDPLVVLHSGGMSSAEWEPHLASLAEHFRVIAPDLPGHGRTPVWGNRLSIPLLAEAVLATLDAEGIPRAHVMGSSMGGSVALWVGLHAPERVDRLVLFRAGHRRSPQGAAIMARMADPAWWHALGLSTWMSRIHEPQGGPEAWKTVIRRVAEMFAHDTEHLHTPAELSTVRSATLIIVGDRDPIVPLEHAVEMFRAMPHADLWVIPHATHVVGARTWRRDCFLKEVIRFLTRTP